MKTIEVLRSYSDKVEGIDFKHIPSYKYQSVANDIDSYRHEHYMKFIKWINENYYNDTAHVNGDADKWTGKYKDSNIEENRYSTEQVYQYWLTEINK